MLFLDLPVVTKFIDELEFLKFGEVEGDTELIEGNEVVNETSVKSRISLGHV